MKRRTKAERKELMMQARKAILARGNGQSKGIWRA